MRPVRDWIMRMFVGPDWKAKREEKIAEKNKLKKEQEKNEKQARKEEKERKQDVNLYSSLKKE